MHYLALGFGTVFGVTGALFGWGLMGGAARGRSSSGTYPAGLRVGAFLFGLLCVGLSASFLYWLAGVT